MISPTSQPRYLALLKQLLLISFFGILSSPSTLLAEEQDSEEQQALAMAEQEMLALFYETSSLPTRTAQAFDKLPAVMSVVTAEQMRKMGARDLRDVLRLIPGLQMGIGAVGYSQVTMRGMASHGAEKLKFMVDGHNVDIALTGGSALFFADYPIDSVQKVEFLRGPGSALYGSDALLGVINIVTRKKTNHNKTEVTARLGSFDSQRYNLESAGSLGPVKIWGSANYLTSNGADVFVATDALSSSAINSDISNAPGHTSEWVERTILNLSAETEHIQFQGQYINHEDGGFFNPGMSLTDQTSIGRDYFWTNLGYENNFLDNQLTFKAELSYNRYNHDYDVAAQPAGFSTANNIYTDDLHSITEAVVDEYGFTLQADGYFFNQHTITLGSEVRSTDLHDVFTTANYNPAPLPALQDVSSDFNWMKEADRLYYGIFLQDQYQYGDNLVVVIGGRYDYYDDFGSAFSPNLGVAYHFLPNWQFKLLYGQAFRAPSFRELYKLPTGTSLQGDPELQAESVKTWQTVLEWKSSNNLTTSITAYHNDFSDTINTFVNENGISTFENQADSQSFGFDLELRGKIPSPAIDLSWFTIVSYIDSQQADGSDRPGVASWLGSAGFDYSFAKNINLNTTMHYTGEIYLDPTDPRDEPESYLLVDTAITIYNALGRLHGLDTTWSIHNLFDQDYVYPEISGKMPGHFPRPGISTELWLTYHF
jgi:outer membrane receptor protein involved in Fe transport